MLQLAGFSQLIFSSHPQPDVQTLQQLMRQYCIQTIGDLGYCAGGPIEAIQIQPTSESVEDEEVQTPT